jgi:hypothetical protein
MKQTLEEAAKQELISSYAIVIEGELVYQRQAMLNMFKKGADWQSKQSPWISVKERLPEENKEYLVVLDNRVVYVAQYNKNNKSWLIYGTGYTYNVVAYMPIPSFDEILEANRDVLERIKDKGD